MAEMLTDTDRLVAVLHEQANDGIVGMELIASEELARSKEVPPAEPLMRALFMTAFDLGVRVGRSDVSDLVIAALPDGEGMSVGVDEIRRALGVGVDVA